MSSPTPTPSSMEEDYEEESECEDVAGSGAILEFETPLSPLETPCGNGSTGPPPPPAVYRRVQFPRLLAVAPKGLILAISAAELARGEVDLRGRILGGDEVD